jgi:hypothetical protein
MNNGNASTGDSILYTFDQPVTAPAAGYGPFNYFTSTGDEYSCSGTTTTKNGTATPTGCTTVRNPTNFDQILVTFGSAAGQLAQAVGASVGSGAVTNANNAATNDNDELKLTNTAPGATVTPGTVAAPQLVSVHVTSGTNGFGQTILSAVYTFTQPVASTGPAAAGGAVGLHLYDADGTELTCNTTANSASVGTGANANQVTCTSFIQGGTGVAGTAATNTQVSSAKLGTADAGAVTGSTAPNNNPNPEGGVATS